MTKRAEGGPEEVTLAKTYMLKEFSEIFHDIENAKDEVL